MTDQEKLERLEVLERRGHKKTSDEWTEYLRLEWETDHLPRPSYEPGVS